MTLWAIPLRESAFGFEPEVELETRSDGIALLPALCGHVPQRATKSRVMTSYGRVAVGIPLSFLVSLFASGQVSTPPATGSQRGLRRDGIDPPPALSLRPATRPDLSASSATSPTRNLITDSQGRLFSIDVEAAGTVYLGQTPQVMLDIAIAGNGQLYGIDSHGLFQQTSTLYRIDLPGASTHPVRDLGVFLNALEFRSDGFLVAAGQNVIYEIDATTGSVSARLTLPSQYQSAGDIAADADGNMYATMANGAMLRIAPDFATYEDIGPTGFGDFFGLLFLPPGVLYGVRNAEQIYTIDLRDGSTDFIASISEPAVVGVYGATTDFHPPPFSWPVASADRTLSQDYAEYNSGAAGKYHTGLDISAAFDSEVRAVASGDIVLIQENDKGCDPNLGGDCDDHGFGNTVIVRHRASLFTQYSHLASVDQKLKEACGPANPANQRAICAVPVHVAAATTLGHVGCTGYGLLNGCGPHTANPPPYHLHFEAKVFGYLTPGYDGKGDNDSGTCDGKGSGFGYTSNEPDVHGYRDPIAYLHNVAPLNVPSRLQISGDGTPVLMGPQAGYPGITTLDAGSSLIAVRKSEGTVDCAAGWIQARPLCGRLHTNEGNEFPDGWICADLGSLVTSPETSFCTTTLCRIVDTQSSCQAGLRTAPPISAGEVRIFTIAGRCEVPLTARMVSVNVTVDQPTADGHLTIYPAGTALPKTSTINYRAGQTRANNAVVGLTNGTIAVFCGQGSGTARVILDVSGYFE
jgi:Peptidase family M23